MCHEIYITVPVLQPFAHLSILTLATDWWSQFDRRQGCQHFCLYHRVPTGTNQLPSKEYRGAHTNRNWGTSKPTHTHSTSDTVKNTWFLTSIPLHVFMACCNSKAHLCFSFPAQRAKHKLCSKFRRLWERQKISIRNKDMGMISPFNKRRVWVAFPPPAYLPRTFIPITIIKVGITTGYGLDGRGVGVRVPAEFFFSPCRSDRFWGSPGVKRLQRKAYHSSPTSAEVKNTLIYTSTPHISSWRSA
jgi:hypothetical protein